MNQFTLRQIPEELNERLKVLAKQKGSSVNRTIVSLLANSTGLGSSDGKRRDLSQLSGTWSKKQAEQFTKHLEIFDKIDKEVWQS